MKATPNDQKQLLSVQAIDTRLIQFERTEKTFPEKEQLIELNASLHTVMQQVRGVEGKLEDVRTELQRIEADVAVVEARIHRDTARLQSSSSVKDVQALQTELQSLEGRRSELEDIQLSVMEKIENLETEHAGIEREREKIAHSVTETQQQLDTKGANIAEQRTHALRDRHELTAALPIELIELYERQRERYGIGAALLRGGVSLGSNVKLTESDLAEIRKAAPDDVILCPDSNAILVRTEESGL